jgi:DHA1 family tetracycline resistance protein-like MFS transporter
MGFTMAIGGVASLLVQGLLVGPVVARAGERGALLLGALAGMVGFTIYGFAPTTGAYLCGVPAFALMSLLQPGLQGLMTRKVAPHEQGQLQGANQSLQGIAAVFGPMLFGLTFAWSVRRDAILHAPGLAIYVAAAFMALCFLIGLRTGGAPQAVEASTGQA